MAPSRPAPLLAILAVLLLVPAPSRATTLEYAVKASYISKFVDYIDWPAGALASPSGPFNVCIAGDDPFGAALDQAVSGRKAAGHPIVVRRLKRVDAGSGCQVLFVAGSRAQTVAEALRTVQGEPVLTVADHGPASGGAIVQFVVQDNRVRFDIDPAAAASAHIAISSKLMGLAVSTRAGA